MSLAERVRVKVREKFCFLLKLFPLFGAKFSHDSPFPGRNVTLISLPHISEIVQIRIS